MKIRLPADLKDRIEEMSKQAGRSMNAEIVARLEGSFSRRGGLTGLWQCFLDLVRLQSQMESLFEMKTSYLKEASDLFESKADTAGAGGAAAEIASLNERIQQVQRLAARLEEDLAALYQRRVSLEDKIGTMIEEALASSGEELE